MKKITSANEPLDKPTPTEDVGVLPKKVGFALLGSVFGLCVSALIQVTILDPAGFKIGTGATVIMAATTLLFGTYVRVFTEERGVLSLTKRLEIRRSCRKYLAELDERKKTVEADLASAAEKTKKAEHELLIEEARRKQELKDWKEKKLRRLEREGFEKEYAEMIAEKEKLKRKNK